MEARTMEMTGLDQRELETLSLDVLEEIMSSISLDEYTSLIQKSLTTRIFGDERWANEEGLSEEDKSDLVVKRLLEKQILSDVESIHEGLEVTRRPACGGVCIGWIVG